jgi:hypothetical protein
MLLDKGARSGPNLLQFVALSPATIPVDIITTLINRGANVNAKTSAGLTMLDFAKRQGNVALVESLTAAGLQDESPAPAPLKPKPAGSARGAIEKSVPALQRTDVAFLEKAGCVSCHNNSLTAMTMAAARAKGMQVNEKIAKDQLRRIAGFMQENAERALENEIGREAIAEGLTVPLPFRQPLLFPPVSTWLGPPPRVLIVSPRARIEVEHPVLEVDLRL